MSSKLFWQSWPVQLKILYWILLIAVIATVLLYAYAATDSLGMVIEWTNAAFFEQIPLVLDQITVDGFTFQIDAENLLILQNISPSEMRVNVWITHLFLIISVLGFTCLLSVTTYFPRFWFIGSMAVWILILSSLRLEMLRLADFTGTIPLIGVSAITILPAYYFNAFSNGKNFVVRALTFIVCFGVIAVLIKWLSADGMPFLLLASNATIPMLLLTVIFSFIIAHEIIAGFIYVITSRSTPGSKNHVHFIIISVFYLLNLTALYLNHTSIYPIDIWTISPYVLLVISFLLGIWGYRQREEQYGQIMSFEPLGAIVYLSLALIAFGTIAFFLGSANDPAVEVIQEAIIFGHLGFGLLFLLFILANFSGPLSSGVAVNKILYKPRTMQYFVFRFAGIIAVFALLIVQNWVVPFNYTFGAYFNQQGDLAKLKDEPIIMQTYYEQSRIYSFLNHHANYMLGNYFEDRSENGKASLYYMNAAERTPSDASYVKLSELYRKGNRYFDALFALQEAEGIMESGKIYNNLGILYSETDIADSAIYFLEKATHFDATKITARANIEAIAASQGLAEYIDSLDLDDAKDDIVALNNKVVRYSQQSSFYGEAPEMIFTKDSANIFGAGLAFNYLINTIYSDDTTGILNLLDVTSKYYESPYEPSIRYGQAVAAYYHHYVQYAFRKMSALAAKEYANSHKFYSSLGYWALEQNAPDQAARFFRYAKESGEDHYAWHEAYSLLADQQPDSALAVLDKYPQDSTAEVALRQMANAEPSGTDYDKMYYIKYHLSPYDTMIFEEMVQSIENTNLKAEAILSFSQKLFNQGLTATATATYARVGGIGISDELLYEKIIKFELKLLAAQQQYSALAQQINEGNIEFPFDETADKIFYSALLEFVSGDKGKAMNKFRWIATHQPFKDFEVVTSINLLRSSAEGRFEIYNLLIQALEINPNSVRLLKAYALEAARIDLTSYADNALNDLRQKLSENDFNAFLEEYQEVSQRADF